MGMSIIEALPIAAHCRYLSASLSKKVLMAGPQGLKTLRVLAGRNTKGVRQRRCLKPWEQHMYYSLNSLKGGYIGDYIGNYYRAY